MPLVPSEASSLSGGGVTARLRRLVLKLLGPLGAGGWNHFSRKVGGFLAYLSAQVGVQALNMVTGFLVIRLLTKGEYANYTIVTTLIPVMLMLSDNGIGAGVMATGRTVWQDNLRLGRVINTAMQLRRRFAIVSFAVVAPILAWMLHRHEVATSTILVLMAVTLVGIAAQISTGILRVVLDLRQKIRSLGKLSLGVAGLRLILVVGVAVVLHLTAFLAVLATTISTVFETFFFARSVRREIAWDAPPDPDYRAAIFATVKKTMPLTIYFCLQSQISIWLISIFGHSEQVADVGSASRLGLLFTTVAGAFAQFAVPRFARSNGRRILFRKLFEVLGFVGFLMVGSVLVTWLWPQPFVWLLGAKYANMGPLIWLVMFSTGLATLAGTLYGLNMSKGWVPPAYLTIPVEIATQVVLLVSLDLSQVKDVLVFTGLGTIPPSIMLLTLLVRRLRKEPLESHAA